MTSLTAASSIVGQQKQQFDCFLWHQQWPSLQPLLLSTVDIAGAAENAVLPNYGK